MRVIKIEPLALAIMESACNQVSPREVSGLALVEIDEDKNFVVRDPYIMDVMTPGFTQINPDKVAQLLSVLTSEERPRLKCWWHRHPILWWSSTDEHTATKHPLGSTPEMVKWAIAIVRTPKGWIGRLDVFKNGKVITSDLPVLTGAEEAIAMASDLEEGFVNADGEQIYDEFLDAVERLDDDIDDNFSRTTWLGGRKR